MVAHGGALFLDELAEFSPSVLETLREPLEEGAVTISRAGTAATYPARFTRGDEPVSVCSVITNGALKA